MTQGITGPFEVTLTPRPADDGADAIPGRLAIEKRFHGDLEASSQGQMLSVLTGVKGSAGYVAIEKVTGLLRGRRGSFVLQHSGLMNRGAPQLSITVVPDSGTDELVGLTGTMGIDVADGRHTYTFDFDLAP